MSGVVTESIHGGLEGLRKKWAEVALYRPFHNTPAIWQSNLSKDRGFVYNKCFYSSMLEIQQFLKKKI